MDEGSHLHLRVTGVLSAENEEGVRDSLGNRSVCCSSADVLHDVFVCVLCSEHSGEETYVLEIQVILIEGRGVRIRITFLYLRKSVDPVTF